MCPDVSTLVNLEPPEHLYLVLENLEPLELHPENLGLPEHLGHLCFLVVLETPVHLGLLEHLPHLLVL